MKTLHLASLLYTNKNKNKNKQLHEHQELSRYVCLSCYEMPLYGNHFDLHFGKQTLGLFTFSFYVNS